MRLLACVVVACKARTVRTRTRVAHQSMYTRCKSPYSLMCMYMVVHCQVQDTKLVLVTYMCLHVQVMYM